MDSVRVRLDAFHLPRKTLRDSWPVVNFTVWVNKCDIGVGVYDAGHTQVLVDALSSSLVFGFHSTGDFQPVFFQRTVGALPQFPAFIGFGGFVFACVKTNIDGGCRGLRRNF